jgi:Glyoxalase-like domain
VRCAMPRCGMGAGLVLLQPDLPEELHGSHLGRGWVYVTVPDPDAHVERALAAGAHVLGEPDDALGGTTRGYSARDPGQPVELRHRPSPRVTG